MESSGANERDQSKIGDRSTSDVVVRLRTVDGRDDRLYCHSHIIIEKSKYFAHRLSDDWPTCQILDSRNCVEVYCEESNFDSHVNLLRLLYLVVDDPVHELWHDVKNALGILRVAVQLECPQIIDACVSYLEAVPWEEAEEEEILKTIPSMGSQVELILARVQPVNSSAIMGIFLAAIRFATSSPPQSLIDLKVTAQEQLEYMLTEDDDAPLLVANDEITSVVKDCVKKLFSKFDNLLQTFTSKPKESVFEVEEMHSFQSHLSDFSWACQILTKLEIMREFVNSWVDRSDKIANVVEKASATNDTTAMKLKVTEVAAKVLETIGYATVILPTAKRLHMVKVWLPFVRATKPAFDSITNKEEAQALKFDGELWQALESTFVSIILALPSGDQAYILKEWLETAGNEHVRYPDLTEAFEVWCYRSKVAKRRLSLVQEGIEGMTCE